MHKFVGGVIVGAVLMSFIFHITEKHTVLYRHGYKQGQIDYANGKVQYRLMKKSDGTVAWEPKE